MPRPLLRMICFIFAFGLIFPQGISAVAIKDVKLKVLAGNADLNAAQKTADHLRGLGYVIPPVDHAARSNFLSSVVYYAKTFKTKAETLATELNISPKDIRPLTWRSEFDIIIVTANIAFAKPEVEEPPVQTITPTPRDYPIDKDLAVATEENISFAVAEAHALFVNKSYQLAQEKYQSIEPLVLRAKKLCAPVSTRSAGSGKKPLAIQVIAKDSNLEKARTIGQRLTDAGYTVSSIEYALRSDLLENTIYYTAPAKGDADAVLSTIAGFSGLVPMPWPSQFDMILVVPNSPSEDIKIIDMADKIARLYDEEQQIKETIDRMIQEAFALLNAGRNCTDVQTKFASIIIHLKRAASVCETTHRLGPHETGPDLSHGNESPEYRAFPETTTILNLEEVISTAVAKNATIEQAEEKLKAAMMEKKSAGADFLPKASLNYSYTRLKDAPTLSLPDELSFFGAGEIAMGSQDIHTWNLTLTQPLFTGYGLLSQYEMKKIGLETSAFQKKTSVLNLVRDVKAAYYNLLLAQKLEQVSRETVKNLQSHQDDAQQFYNQGMIPYNDLLKANVALANAVQENERAMAQTVLAAASLNMLLDYDVNRNIEVLDIPQIPEKTRQLTDLLHEAVENRPELDLITLAVKTTDQAIRAVRSAYYPQVALVGRYEQTGQDLLATENDFGEVESASLTLQANWALFKGGKTGYDVARLQHEKNALVKQFKGAESGIRLEVKSAFENLAVSEKNIITSEKSVAQAQENWRITNIQYQEQIATSTDVLDARTFLSQAEFNYYRALYGYLKSFADLEKAVGKPYPPVSDESRPADPNDD